MKVQAPTDVYKFGEYVFGYQPAPHHREMVDFINEGIRTKQNTIVLEPRGAAKTTWANTINLTHRVATEPDIRIGLFSKTADHAFDMSRGIRSTLERNDQFREVFGNLVSDIKWTDKQWIRAGSKWLGSNQATMFSGGVLGQVVSKRFSLIFLDDILDEESTANIEQMERVQTWFWKTLMPCLTPDGVVIYVGTRWAEGDLAETLITPKIDGGKGWRNLIRGALYEERGELHSYWPEIWSLEKLLGMKEAMGSALFSCAYMNDITGLMAGNIFDRRDFQYFSNLPEGKYTIRMGVDLASSEKERADYTARVTTAEDEQGNFFVLSAHRVKISGGHAQFIEDGWAAYPEMSLVIVENQQFQSTLIEEMMKDKPRIPVMGKRADTDKTTRARAVAARYEGKRVFHHVSLQDSDLEREELSFPKGHDDLVDALGYSMDLGGQDFYFSSASW